MAKNTLAHIRAKEAISALQVAKKAIGITAQGLYRADAPFTEDLEYGAFFGNELHKFVHVVNAECQRLSKLAEEME